MKEDYVSYELAIALKAAGFDEPCDHYWCRVYKNSDKIEMRQSLAADYNNDDWYIPHCSAPTLWQAQKWLREKKGIAINVIAHDGGLYDYDIVFLPNAIETENIPDRSPWCRTYEEALSEGIDSALELIEQENK